MSDRRPEPEIDDIGESELLARIARLPAPEMDPGVADRVGRRARAAFLRRAERARHPLLDRVIRWYGRVEPVMVASVASAYLFWGFASAAALHQY